MKISRTSLPEVIVVEPKVFSDERGFFLETYREVSVFRDEVADKFVQDNQSRSKRGVLRGLHYQFNNPQGKLVRVSRGKVFDVAVDVRVGSPRFGHWYGIELDDQHHRQLWIPPGFAHGFCVLSAEADFVYRCTSYYDPQSDTGIRWDDPTIGIKWPDEPPEGFVISAKDRELPALSSQLAERLPRFDV